MATSGPYLSLTETCRRLGLSRKALRLYEAQGLVQAERTSADWRVYGPDQIARLHRICALKSFGFPLTRIAEILNGKPADLAGFLEFQERVVRQDLEHLQRAARLLAAARGKLKAQGHLSTDDLIFLTQETVMTNQRNDAVNAAYEAVAAKHLTPEERATLERNGHGGMDTPDYDWARLHAEATKLMEAGDPTSIAAMDLARRWMGKVFEATGGDPALTGKVSDMAREVHDTPAYKEISPNLNPMMDFVQKAYGAAIEAGIMPKP